MKESIAGEGRDSTMELTPENIPEELRARTQWTVHRNKEPYDPKTGKRAASNDSQTWGTFDQALAVIEDYDGLEFMFSSGDPLSGLDLDKCRDERTGEIEPWAQEIIEALDGYTEISPSGTGVHIIVKGKLPAGRRKRGNVEAYSVERPFTVTGYAIRHAGAAPERQAELEAFHREHLGVETPSAPPARTPAAAPVTDNEIINKLLEESTGKGRRLFAGDTGDYPSHNEADLALVSKLYFYTQDPDQIDAIFRRSGLYREKWERSDYRHKTYIKAANRNGETYDWTRVYISASNPTNLPNLPNPTNSPNRPNPSVKSAATLLTTDFAPTPWAIPGVLPEGVTLLVGKPKKGKSWMALGFCEAIAAGGVALGTKKVEKGETLYLALEDNERRMQKRLKKVLNGRECPDGLHYSTEWPRLDEGGAEALEDWLKDNPGARLVVIDTLQKVRTPARGKNVYAEDYAALETLMPIAARYGVAIVVVHHLRKGEAADPQDMISGSTGLSGGVDGYLILHKAPGSRGPTLYVEGRDIEEPEEYALHWNFDTATWTIEGTAEEVHMSEERGAILVELNRSPEPMSPKELADVMPGKSHGAVKYLLHQMYHDDQVKRVSGKYEPANRTTNPDTPHGNGKNSRPVSGVRTVRGVGEEVPASFGLKPGESATLQDLKDLQPHQWDCLCEECTT